MLVGIPRGMAEMLQASWLPYSPRTGSVSTKVMPHDAPIAATGTPRVRQSNDRHRICYNRPPNFNRGMAISDHPLQLQAEESQGALVVSVTGRIDGVNAQEFEEKLNEKAESPGSG